MVGYMKDLNIEIGQLQKDNTKLLADNFEINIELRKLQEQFNELQTRVNKHINPPYDYCPHTGR